MRIDRNDFGTSTVYALLKSGTMNHKEALRLLEEAVHVIVLLRQRNDAIREAIAAILEVQ